MTLTQETFHADIAAELRQPEPPPDLPVFTTRELMSMLRWCIKYRDLVQSGGTPTPEQDARFMRFQLVTYTEGVACE